MADRQADDIARLGELTGDRSTALEALRNRYFDTHRDLSGAERDYLFDLASLFARLVYGLHRFASLLQPTDSEPQATPESPRR